MKTSIEEHTALESALAAKEAECEILANALRPWIVSHGGRSWIWPDTAFATAMENGKDALKLHDGAGRYNKDSNP